MPKKLIKIARSFSLKKNLGNYSTADFWMMQEVECAEDEAEKKSEEVYQFVKGQVLKSYNEYGTVAPAVKTNPEQEYQELEAGQGKFPKVYKAKDTDPWRKPVEVTYRAEFDDEGNTIKIPVNKEEETLPPQ